MIPGLKRQSRKIRDLRPSWAISKQKQKRNKGWVYSWPIAMLILVLQWKYLEIFLNHFKMFSAKHILRTYIHLRVGGTRDHHPSLDHC